MTIDEIIAALEAAEGPSRELDVAILDLTCPPTGMNATKWHYRGAPETEGEFYIEAPRVTQKLDAAVWLVSNALLGFHWGITQGDSGDDAAEFQGSVWPGKQPFPAHLEQNGYHSDPRLALCIAILKAVKVKESTHD